MQFPDQYCGGILVIHRVFAEHEVACDDGIERPIVEIANSIDKLAYRSLSAIGETMYRQIFVRAIAITLCYSTTFVYAQQGEENRKKGPAMNPKGDRLRSASRRADPKRQAALRGENGQHARIAGSNRALTQPTSILNRGHQELQPRARLEKNRTNQPTGTQGAAAASAVNKNQTPQATGAQARPRCSKSQSISVLWAQGAAAGAAAANRNQPQYSGAQGAAAGAAVANRNQPQYSGAQGQPSGAAGRQ